MLHSFAGVLILLSTDSKSSSKVLSLSGNPQNRSQKGLLCSYLRFFLFKSCLDGRNSASVAKGLSRILNNNLDNKFKDCQDKDAKKLFAYMGELKILDMPYRM